MRVSSFLSSRSTLLVSLIALMGLYSSGCAQRMDDVEERIEGLQKRTAALEARGGGVAKPSEKELLDNQRVADVRSQVAAMKNDMTVISGKVEALEYENKNLQTRMDQVATELQIKMKEVEELKARANEPRQESHAQSAQPQSEGSDAEYQSAVRAFQDGEFEKSNKLFEAFIKKSPKHPLVPAAIYWQGEGYMARKSYKKAVTKFQDLNERFPKSDKRCDAMARQITGFTELGMKKEASLLSQVRKSECK